MCKRRSEGRPPVTTVEVLRKARELVAAGWTQGHYALDADGKVTEDSSPTACKFCMAGALFRVTNSQADEVWREARRALKAAIGDTLVSFNDAPKRTQDEVVDAFDRAIAAEEAKAVTL